VDIVDMNKGDHVRVRTLPDIADIACTVLGPETIRYWDLDEDIYPDDPEERETGKVLLCMVGDDHVFAVDPEDCSPVALGDFCRECGQIGCREV